MRAPLSFVLLAGLAFAAGPVSAQNAAAPAAAPCAQKTAAAPQGAAQPQDAATPQGSGNQHGSSPGNSGNTGWTGGTGGSYVGTAPAGPNPGSPTVHPEVAHGLDPMKSVRRTQQAC